MCVVVWGELGGVGCDVCLVGFNATKWCLAGIDAASLLLSFANLQIFQIVNVQAD